MDGSKTAAKATRLSAAALFCFGSAFWFGRVDTARAQSKPPTSDARITVIGCVQRTESSSATVGTTVIPEGATRYVLSNITLAGEPDRTETGIAGAKSELLAQGAKSYRLDDAADALIAPHVGDRVEVTGTVFTKSRTPIGTSGTTPPSSAESNAAPTLHVESLRKISSNSTACLQ